MYLALIISILLLTQVTPAVTVTTDRAWYAPGEIVSIQVVVLGPFNDTLDIYVDNPEGRNIWYLCCQLAFAGEGTGFIWTFNVTIPPDAPLGAYTVTVTWDHRYVETGFIVEGQPIPEFSFAPLVLIFAFAIAYAAILGRKASARAQASNSHP